MYIKVQESKNCRKNFHKFLGLKEALLSGNFYIWRLQPQKLFSINFHYLCGTLESPSLKIVFENLPSYKLLCP